MEGVNLFLFADGSYIKNAEDSTISSKIKNSKVSFIFIYQLSER